MLVIRPCINILLFSPFHLATYLVSSGVVFHHRLCHGHGLDLIDGLDDLKLLTCFSAEQILNKKLNHQNILTGNSEILKIGTISEKDFRL